MPNCCVPQCSSRTTKSKIYMARFPSDPGRKEVWIRNIGTTNWEPKNHSYVCEIHFSSDMWEKTRVDGKRKLKCNAVPTIFPVCLIKSDTTCIITNDHINEFVGTQPDVVVEALDHIKEEKYCLESDVIPLNVSHVTPLVSNNFADSSISSHSNKICNEVDEVEWLKKQIREANKKLKLANEKLDVANKIILKMNRNNNLLKKHIKRLTRTMSQAENNEHLKSLKKLLNDDQIRVLMNQSSRGYTWSNDTIEKALRLKSSCGSNGYQELRKQSMPLPSERTLRRKMKNNLI